MYELQEKWRFTTLLVGADVCLGHVIRNSVHLFPNHTMNAIDTDDNVPIIDRAILGFHFSTIACYINLRNTLFGQDLGFIVKMTVQDL